VQEHDITFTVSSTMIRTCNQTSQLWSITTWNILIFL
jgi:hypothetical protein